MKLYANAHERLGQSFYTREPRVIERGTSGEVHYGKCFGKRLDHVQFAMTAGRRLGTFGTDAMHFETMTAHAKTVIG